MRALAVAAAVLAAGAASAQDDGRKYYYEDVLTPFFARDPRDPARFVNVRPESDPAAFPARKDPAAFRVFLIGSSIAGVHMEHGRHFGEALARALPGRKVEAVNAAMPGYDSYREGLVAAEVLDHAPDALVLMSGHDEGAGARPPPLWVQRLRRGLEGWAWFRGLAARLAPAPPPRTLPERLQARDAEFEANLRATLRGAAARGVPVAVCVPPINLRQSPPAARGAPGPGFLRGWVRFLNKDLARARRAWEESLAALDLDGGPDRPLTLFYLARVAERRGDRARAEALYGEALDVEGLAGCGPRCAALMRRVASEEGAPLADLDAAFRAAAAPRLPGLDLFRDRVHWRRRMNPLVSREVARALAGASRLAAAGWDPRGLAAAASEPGAHDPDAEARATVREAVLSLSKTQPYLSWQAAEYLAHALETAPRLFDDVPALLRDAAAGREGPRRVWGVEPPAGLEAAFLWHLGEARLRRGDPGGARRDLERAAALAAPPRVQLSLALARALAGDADGSGRALADASRDLPEEAAALAAALAVR